MPTAGLVIGIYCLDTESEIKLFVIRIKFPSPSRRQSHFQEKAMQEESTEVIHKSYYTHCITQARFNQIRGLHKLSRCYWFRTWKEMRKLRGNPR